MPAGGTAAGLLRLGSPRFLRLDDDDARTQRYLRTRTRACPWCGARCQLVDGCPYVYCAACNNPWCFRCGSRSPAECTHAYAVERLVGWARSAPAWEVRALRWVLVGLAGACVLPFAVAVCAVAAFALGVIIALQLYVAIFLLMPLCAVIEAALLSRYIASFAYAEIFMPAVSRRAVARRGALGLLMQYVRTW